MYLVLSWFPFANTDPDQARSAIQREFNAIPFVNAYEMFPSHVIANVDRRRSRQDILDLARRLNSIAPGRFSFSLYYVPQGHYVAVSPDLDVARCDRIADYG
jgi:hypothetical protein